MKWWFVVQTYYVRGWYRTYQCLLYIVTLFIMMYYPFTPSQQMSITITLGEVWGSLALMAEGLVLQWEGDDRFKLTTAGRALPCALLSGGLVGASAYILRDEARAVRGFTVPGLVYGAVFEKKS